MAWLETRIARVNDWVWGWTLLGLLMAVGVWLTVRTRALPHRRLGLAFRYMLRDEAEGEGEVSAFASLCTALSATIGTGNIVGVATAVCVGGPGALFWMLVAAVVGMATKYAEGVLAIKYRHRTGHGWMGGPFCYIEDGMGPPFRWLAKLFALFGVLAGTLGIGTAVQSNSIAGALDTLSGSATTWWVLGRSYSPAVVIGAGIVTLLAALVLMGGLQRIAAVSQVVVPVAGVVFVLLQVVMLVVNLPRLPAAVGLILRSAFAPQAALGAGSGITLKLAVQLGVGRGVFSNEAGMGSAPIAAASARTTQPVRQGLVSMLGTFIDTVVMCTLTGLVIVVTDSWRQPGIEGVAVTATAFVRGLPFLSEKLVTWLLLLCLIAFAFTTILGWHVYCERCLVYLTGDRVGPRRVLRVAYIGAVALGPFMSLKGVWDMANVFNGLMAFPNLIALVALSGVVAAETRRYFKKV